MKLISGSSGSKDPGDAVIVAAMEAHPEHGTVQTHGLALFRRLASTDPRRLELGLAGAVERTVRAMTKAMTATEAAAGAETADADAGEAPPVAPGQGGPAAAD